MYKPLLNWNRSEVHLTMSGTGIDKDRLFRFTSLPFWARATSLSEVKKACLSRQPLPPGSARSHIWLTKTNIECAMWLMCSTGYKAAQVNNQCVKMPTFHPMNADQSLKSTLSTCDKTDSFSPDCFRNDAACTAVTTPLPCVSTCTIHLTVNSTVLKYSDHLLGSKASQLKACMLV